MTNAIFNPRTHAVYDVHCPPPPAERGTLFARLLTHWTERRKVRALITLFTSRTAPRERPFGVVVGRKPSFETRILRTPRLLVLRYSRSAERKRFFKRWKRSIRGAHLVSMRLEHPVDTISNAADDPTKKAIFGKLMA